MNLNLNLDLINKIVHESDFYKIHSDFYKDSDIYMGKQGHAFEHRKLLGHFMYENLWSKIPDYEKICVSHLGNVSGTGIINFNSDNKIIIT